MQYGNNTYPYNTLCNCRFSPKFRIREKQFDRKKPTRLITQYFFHDAEHRRSSFPWCFCCTESGLQLCSEGLRLTTRDVILGGFFMEGARKNKARHPGGYSSIR